MAPSLTIDERIQRLEEVSARLIADLARHDAKEEAHERNVATFWGTHWAGLCDDVGDIRAVLAEHGKRLREIDSKLEELRVKMWQVIAVAAASGAFGASFEKVIELAQ